jgi:hypothetical protein
MAICDAALMLATKILIEDLLAATAACIDSTLCTACSKYPNSTAACAQAEQDPAE